MDSLLQFLTTYFTNVTWIGALELGLIYALVALGGLISYKILDFPDLTADGSFPLGGGVCVLCILHHIDPWIATLCGMFAGAVAGMITASLHIGFKIEKLLASILMMIALYSINLRIMGSPNVSLLGEATIYDVMTAQDDVQLAMVRLLMAIFVVIIAKLIFDLFFATQIGLAVRATGTNPRMAKAQGIAINKMTLLGMAISNGLIALAGSLYVQSNGGFDISIGVGTIVIGLAAVIIGEAIFSAKRIICLTAAVIIGSILYRFFIALALNNETLNGIGFGPQDLNLITALLVVAVLALPKFKHKFTAKRGR
ncbi:ABC transporter permease [Glaesserella parasuis]|uniref:ABC transporter inner membrane subunit n=2 Tax=Glaesserella parasuis TaxID=738 RepID=A0A806J9A0_GLAPU|nr:ABC transporter inner membrane subunit [Glaesserella parasuis]AGO15475.1 ABC transporter inner membrane subunit [Glaesserella parasuis ZJ0906]AIK16363.1 ABC transporter permease [Glaesserella parasuis]AIK90988.1 ABC transporter permease [Glaesserella parasuis]ATW44954.1 ABC transporter permease [Glaesserella parasuis str. Nagasaki]EQA02130.1 branched-chain amino acid transport system / permease component family protein [Glaesserella parasuis str. Nagasaki]